MAKYQQYAEYKDSGYFHLGEIPKDWKILKLKHLTRCLDGQRIPLNAIERGEKKGNIPYWGANKIVDYVDDWIFYEQLILLGEDGAPFFDPNKDVAFLVNGKIWPNNHVHVLRPFKKLVNPTFLTYAINCTDFSLYISGSTRDKLNQSDMDNICIRYCSQAEQTQIANFLDHETAKIDSLIEKQQQLIELLKEKRQAVISHAVTKGLNPNVPMKDSGVEWLGDVPEHWNIVKLSQISLAFNGDRGANYPSGNDFVDEGIYFISANEVVNAKVITETASRVTQKKYNELGGLKIKKGDIIYCLRGAGVGKNGICDFNEGTVSSSLMGIRSIKLDPDYLVFLLNSSAELQQRSVLVNGSVSPNLSAENVMGYKFAIPAMNEQAEIKESIKLRVNKIEVLLLRAHEAIQLIQERRTALISAAVTGKIDVRNWQNPNNNNEAKTEFSA